MFQNSTHEFIPTEAVISEKEGVSRCKKVAIEESGPFN